MRVIVIDGIHHWGFSIRNPLASAASESYPVPPPTTIIGALGRVYCNEMGYAVKGGVSCTRDFIENEVSRDVRWVTYSLVDGGSMLYADIVRELRITYRQSKYRDPQKEFEPQESFGVAAFGKSYAANARFRIFLVLTNGANEDKWVKLGWQIVNLGSKESIVSVINVKVKDLVRELGTSIKTAAYFPRDCLSSDPSVLRGLAEVIELPISNQYNLTNKPKLVFKTKAFIVPKIFVVYGGFIKLSKNDLSVDCEVYSVNDCPDCGNVIVPTSDFLRKIFGTENLGELMLMGIQHG